MKCSCRFILCITLYPLLPVFCYATVWYVHPDSALNTIQAGLDSCTENDIVLVAPGVYVENILWPSTQGIHLISEYGPDLTIIDGDSAGRVIELNTGFDTTTIIRGFTIQNGFSNENGGGIFCDAFSSPLITENVIQNNYAYWNGGGISCLRSSPTIRNNEIRDNIAGSYIGLAGCGGGINSWRSGPIITNNIIAYNQAVDFYGGGVYCYLFDPYHRDPVISNNLIIGNSAIFSGGGIDCSNAGVLIHGNMIRDNFAGIAGGGIAFYEDSASVVRNDTIIHNNTGIRGGGISIENISSPTIKTSVISYNEAGIGAGIYCTIQCSSLIESCTVSYNNIDGIYCWVMSLPTIRYCDIVSNVGYGVGNRDSTRTISSEYNWWGDSTGPYHPDSNPGGLGDTVSDYVDFIPWLYWPGVEEQPLIKPVVNHTIAATIFAGPLILPAGKKCKVFDITGRVVMPDRIKPGIYFIEIDGEIRQKIIKIR